MSTGMFSTEAEQIVIGCCLQGEVVADRVVGLRPEHFAIAAHKEAFEAIQRLWGKGKPVDPMVLDESLPGSGGDSGGLAYWLDCANAGFSFAMLPGYVAIVTEKAVRRAMVAVADQIVSLAHSEGTVDEKVAEASSLIAKLAEGRVTKGPRLISEVLREHLPTISDRWEGVEDGLKVGFVDLDKILSGMKPGNLVLIAARPAMGKTSLAMQIAAGLSYGDDGAVVAFSQEMADTELTDRLIALEARVPLDKVLKGGMTSDELDRFAAATARIDGLKMFIDDSPAQRITDIRAKVQMVRRRHKVKLVVVDYLQLMTGDGANRNAEIEQISRGLKSLAKETGCPIIALSQLSRQCESRPNKRPMLSDLRDSGAIEQDADIVMMIYRDEVYNPDTPDAGTAEILVRKNRQGKTGDARLTWLGEFTCFADCFYQESREDNRRDQRSAGRRKGREGFE